MMRLTATAARFILVGLIVLGGTRTLAAQTGREALARGTEAHEFADFETAVRLLSRGLDPSAGPRDAAWSVGLHKLVDAVIAQGRRPLADVWLRWALRLEPELPFDSVNFASAVKEAFDAARAAVRASTQDQGLVVAAWEWGDPVGSPNQGALRIARGEVELSARIEGGATLLPGVDRVLAPGSYTIIATAEGRLPARVTNEVLPGITTVLTFNLAPAAPGLLYVASRPWGMVVVDGKRIGYTTIAAHRLPAGVRRLRIERDGYFPFDTTLTVLPDQRLRLGTILLRARSR